MKIGFNVKKIYENVILYVEDLFGQLGNMIDNHETRITTLENNSSGGTAKTVYYIHDDYLYKDSNLITKVTADEFTTSNETTIITILNLSDMENLGTYMPLFIKSTVDVNGHDVIKVFIMLENGTLKAVYTAPFEQQSGVQ